MSPYEILNTVIETLQTELDIRVYNTFPESKISHPIKEEVITVELFSGAEYKTLLELKTYMPQMYGSRACRNLTEQARKALSKASIQGFNELTAYSVNYDENLRAYVQESRTKFEILDAKKILVPIDFGDEVINATGETIVKYSRNILIYYSPIAGAQCSDLGCALRKVEGKAVLDQQQFEKLTSLVKSGETRTISVGSDSFKAVLISLSGRPDSKIEFTFLEVPQ